MATLNPEWVATFTGIRTIDNLMEWMIEDYNMKPRDAYVLITINQDFKINVYQMAKNLPSTGSIIPLIMTFKSGLKLSRTKLYKQISKTFKHHTGKNASRHSVRHLFSTGLPGFSSNKV